MNASATPRVLEAIFEDSLGARWTLESPPGVNASEDSDSRPFCTRHLRLALLRNTRVAAMPSGLLAVLRARSPILGLDEHGMDARVTFLARASGAGALHDALRLVPPCRGEHNMASSTTCGAAVCVALQSGVKRPPAFVSACLVHAVTDDAAANGPWRRFAVSTRALGVAQPQALLLASGLISGSVALVVNELQITALSPPRRVVAPFFDGPAPPGAEWAASAGATPLPPSKTGAGPGWCQYMSSDFRPGAKRPSERGRRQAPRCLMDGDHLRGRWVQNCDPAPAAPLRRRPDLYAYGRPMPRVQGKFDFRVCYRTSFWERERALQALSWTWRPYDCRLEPFDGAAFDKWLGTRTLVIIGDSLTAQLFYSFVLLLGGAVAGTAEHADGVRRGRASDGAGGTAADPPAPPICSTGVADEGLSSFSEVRLASGGRVIKVLGHTRYIQELQRVERAPWLRFVQAADFLVLNIGHHYRSVDRTFAGYTEMVRQVESSLSAHLKPTAHVVVRTTNVGHRGCENATRPLQDRRAAWERLAERPGGAFEWTPPAADAAPKEAGRGNPHSASSGRKDPFDWRAPALHEGAWAQVFGATSSALHRRFSLLNLSFVDSRVDGHVANAMRYSDESERKAHWGGGLDCLHYCFPGPVDFWSLSLFNLLTRLK